ncbi:MAG: hydroxymethylbilane synthase [Calditrichaeota bacterium]|nr:MAG: hydroxymethylbilane synthase [Calditrichota bacterium]
MSKQNIVIGSRGSDLALYQANFIKSELENKYNCDVEIKIIKTSGDKIDNISFDKMEGKGFFTKELEDALLAKEIDIAVHSLKDLMTSQPDGLKTGAVGYRADKRELLLIRKESTADTGVFPVKDGGVIGTSSNRRKCQVAFLNKSLEIKDLRGNVPTRIQKLRDGQYDAILLAAAGVRRLELDVSDLTVIELDPETFLPAPAQGILGIQLRDDAPEVEATIVKMNAENDVKAAALERGLLAKFDSGCSLPLGVYSEVDAESYRLKAVLGVLEGDKWTGLKKVDITGTDIEEIVEEAFQGLEKGKLCPVSE